MNRGGFYVFIVFLVPIAFFMTWGVALAQDTETGALREEIRFLRQRLTELEEKLAEQEKSSRTVSEKVGVIDTRLKEAIEKEESSWYKDLKVEGGIVAVAQGSDGRREAGDKTDGNLRMHLGLTSAAIPDGTIRLEFRQGRGTGLGTEVDSFTGINDTVYDESADIYEAWYEHRFFGEKLRATIGKMDFTNYFDGNEVAHCECTRFMSAGFIWNPAVEWVSNSPGVILNYDVRENLYLRLGAAGTSEWENIAGHPFAIAEIGLSGERPYPGNYRFYAWLNSKDHDKWADLALGVSSDNKKGWGAGFSLDQQLLEDVSLFARLGYQDENYYKFNVFWSLGGEVAGKRWRRPNDVLGIAYGMAALSNEYEKYEISGGNTYINKDEGHLELYYRIRVNDHLSISPDFQVLFHPLGDQREDEVYVGAIRGFVKF